MVWAAWVAKKARHSSRSAPTRLGRPPKITDQIMNGGQKMPPFSDSLTDKEIAQMVAYLRARHRPVPPPSDNPNPAPPGL